MHDQKKPNFRLTAKHSFLVLMTIQNSKELGTEMKIFAMALCIFFAGTASFAACPSQPPNLSSSHVSDGDQLVNAKWLKQNLSGRRIVYSGAGVETYSSDGTYSWKAGTTTWSADSYKFYKNGVRCIGYDNPRFDLYVVNSGQLVLVNGQNERYIGSIKK